MNAPALEHNASGEAELADSEMRVLIADDHPLVRGALREALTGLVGDIDIAEAGSFEEVSAALANGQEADLVLLDLTMPGVQGFSGLLFLRAQHPTIPVIIVSGNEDRTIIRRAIELGASGYIPKSVDVETTRKAVRLVLDGEIWTPDDVDLLSEPDRETTDMVKRLNSLTPQQVRVLMMLSSGLLNKQIAYELSVSEATVKAHVSAILQKLNVDSRTQAVIAASKISAGHWSADTAA